MSTIRTECLRGLPSIWELHRSTFHTMIILTPHKISVRVSVQRRFGSSTTKRIPKGFFCAEFESWAPLALCDIHRIRCLRSCLYPPMVGVQVCTIAVGKWGFMMSTVDWLSSWKRCIYIVDSCSSTSSVCPWKMFRLWLFLSNMLNSCSLKETYAVLDITCKQDIKFLLLQLFLFIDLVLLYSLQKLCGSCVVQHCHHQDDSILYILSSFDIGGCSNALWPHILARNASPC